jgi:hypothetical protein
MQRFPLIQSQQSSKAFAYGEFISFYEKLPRPAHAPYLRPVGKKETEPKRLFGIHATAILLTWM